MRKWFSEAWVEGYEPLIAVMTNDQKDRHVLAAAVLSNSDVIVTYDKNGFPAPTLERWGIERQGPSHFLRNLYDSNPNVAVDKLHKQADAIGFKLEELLVRLRENVPGFVAYLCEKQNVDLP